MSMIRHTTDDKVRGRVVKYRKGDCLSIKCSNGKYLAAFLTGKFNKYYDLTLLDFYRRRKPTMKDFEEGLFFGTRNGSVEDHTFLTDRCMVECNYVDSNVPIEKIGMIALMLADFSFSSYHYEEDIEALRNYYLSEIPTRITKTENSAKFPDLGFIGRHLIPMKSIVIHEPI